MFLILFYILTYFIFYLLNMVWLIFMLSTWVSLADMLVKSIDDYFMVYSSKVDFAYFLLNLWIDWRSTLVSTGSKKR